MMKSGLTIPPSMSDRFATNSSASGGVMVGPKRAALTVCRARVERCLFITWLCTRAEMTYR